MIKGLGKKGDSTDLFFGLSEGKEPKGHPFWCHAFHRTRLLIVE